MTTTFKLAPLTALALSITACDGATGPADAAVADARVEADASPAIDGGPSEFPSLDNTGIPDGACPDGLTPAGPEAERPESGSTFECVLFADFLPYIPDSVSNVTYRYCRFETSSADSFINLQGGPVLIEDSELVGGAGTWIRASYEAHGLTVRRSELAGMANAVEWGTNDVVLEGNLVHDFGNVEDGQHADGFQCDGVERFVIRNNTVLMGLDTWGATSALLVAGTDSIVEGNLLGGAGYTIHVAGDLQVTGNRVTTMFSERSGEYGPVYPEALDATGTWEDNAWYDGPNAGVAIDAP